MDVDHSVRMLSMENGLDFAVQVQETGPTLLLVHGFPLDHTQWRMQVGRLGRHCRMIAPDLRGFGRSLNLGNLSANAPSEDDTDFSVGPVLAELSMEQLADDLAETLEALHETEPVTVCGLAMGGSVALQFWKRHRERLHSLILCSTRAAADPPNERQAQIENSLRVQREGTDFLIAQMLPKMMSAYTRARQPLLTADVRRAMERASPAGVAAALKGMAQRADLSAVLPQIDVPTLVLGGGDDTITPPAEMQQMAAAIPAAEFVTIPQAGHLAPLESPLAANVAIEQFLKKIGRIS